MSRTGLFKDLEGIKGRRTYKGVSRTGLFKDLEGVKGRRTYYECPELDY